METSDVDILKAALDRAIHREAQLGKLRAPFPPNQISKLPKPTKAQTEAVKTDFKKGIRCTQCQAWHHPDVIHLDYVGHAALTDRLLDVDPNWSWEAMALRDGLPAFDGTGGLWIKLTVLGVTRLGYGHAEAKTNQDPGAREKEVIGDALRNAAMRFGAALDLWHKGDLHVEETGQGDSDKSDPAKATKPAAKDKAEPKGKWPTATGLRNACKQFIFDAGKLEDRTAFNAFIGEHGELIDTVKERQNDWWFGGPKVEQSMKEQLDALYEALPGNATETRDTGASDEESNYDMLLRHLNASKSVKDLADWFKTNGRFVEGETQEHRDTLRERYRELEEGFKQRDVVNAG